MTSPNKISDWVSAFVAVAVVALVAGTAIVLLSRPIPASNETIIGQLQGSLWTSLGMIVSYFFGSSHGARTKDSAIEAMAKTAQTAGVALGTAEASTTVLLPGDNATVEPKRDGATVITKHPAEGGSTP